MEDKKTIRPAQSVFMNGIALTLGIAFTIDAYVFAKNLPIEGLLFYSLPLIALVLTGLATTYFAYKRLSNSFNLPIHFVTILYGTATIELGLLLLRCFIYYRFPFGYIFLPIAVDVVGALILVGIVSILRSKINDFTKMGILLFIIVLTTTAVILTK